MGFYAGFGFMTMNRSTLALVQLSHRLSVRTLSLFSSSGLNPTLINALKASGFEKPTWIQQTVIADLLKRKTVAFADQTGSGKTIAYLLPLLSNVKSLEESSGLLATPGYPRAIVVAPSRELAVQIGDVAKLFSHHIKLTVRLLLGGKSISQQRHTFKESVDVVIATPGRLRQLVDGGLCRLNNIRTVVFDEADTLFDHKSGFMDDIQNGLLNKIPKSNETQFVFVSATLTQQNIRHLQSRFPNLKVTTSDQLHKLPQTLKLNFIDVGGRDKLAELISIVTEIQSKYQHLIIFCNTIDSCRAVEYGLKDAGLSNVTSVHGGILPKTRKTNFESFKSAFKPILVATDISCRGIDLPVSSSIVMFDFPTNLTEFLHRAGRTARIGNEGHAYVLVAKRDQALAQRLKTSIETGTEINPSSPKVDSGPDRLNRSTSVKQRQSILRMSSQTKTREPTTKVISKTSRIVRGNQSPSRAVATKTSASSKKQSAFAPVKQTRQRAITIRSCKARQSVPRSRKLVGTR